MKHKPTVKISKLTDNSLVQILHMDDYFSDEGSTPYAGKPHKCTLYCFDIAAVAFLLFFDTMMQN